MGNTKTTALERLLLLDTCNIREALKTIDERGHGIAFVVDKDGYLRGVVTDGDIRRALLKGFLPTRIYAPADYSRNKICHRVRAAPTCRVVEERTGT